MNGQRALRNDVILLVTLATFQRTRGRPPDAYFFGEQRSEKSCSLRSFPYAGICEGVSRQRAILLLAKIAVAGFGPAAVIGCMHWKIDECALYFDRLRLRGWAFHASKAIVGIDVIYDQSQDVIPLGSFGVRSVDLVSHFGARAARSRFDEWISGSKSLGLPFSLRFRFSDGSEDMGTDALTNAAWGDPYFQSWENYIGALGAFTAGTVLEIGSRARSAVTRRHRIQTPLEYPVRPSVLRPRPKELLPRDLQSLRAFP